MISVLFVCLGNICRSPMGEGAFLHLLKEHGLQDHVKVDSAGTSAYHIGETADKRMREVAFGHGVTLPSIARQLTKEDFYTFDYILAMDNQNFQDITAVQPEDGSAKVRMMREFDSHPEDGNVPDPYYGGLPGFQNVYEMCMRSAEGLLQELKEHHELA